MRLLTGYLAILSGAPNLEAARQFVAFSSRPSSMAGVARYISYGPTRLSARPLVSAHAEAGVAQVISTLAVGPRDLCRLGEGSRSPGRP